MATPLKRTTPRPDQHDALAAVQRWADRGSRRGQLIEAPGTGKTLLALWIAEQLGAPLIAYAAPSLTLLDQTIRTWASARETGRSIEQLIICSDTTVADDISPGSLAFPPTTDTAAIRRWLCAPIPIGTQRQVFVTYQSAARLGTALREAGMSLSLLLADEAHRLAAPGQSLFRAVLDDQFVPAKRRLFLTGTPRIGRVVGTSGQVVEPELALDDYQRFGEVLHRLSFGDAIRQGLLVDYEIDIVLLTDPELDPETVGNSAALAAAVCTDLTTGKLRRGFSFHRDRRAALTFQECLRNTLATVSALDSSAWTTAAVFGSHPVNERVEALTALRNGQGILVSVRALSEGIDVPELDAVLIVDPKRSTVDIAQVVGRALRRDPTNPCKRAKIVLPIVVPPTEDPESALATSAWEPVWRVVAAMASHDERLAAELARSTRTHAAHTAGTDWRIGTTAQPDKNLSKVRAELPLHFRLPPGVSPERMIRAVTLAAVQATADPFEIGMGHLEAYIAQHGSAAVPDDFDSLDSFALGRWCVIQRRLHAQGRLAEERLHRLTALPGWKWSEVDPDWERGYSVMRQFVRGHHHTRVPIGWIDRRGYWLGSWIMSIRAAYHARILSPERIALMETLPGWTWGRAETSASWRVTMSPRYTRQRTSSLEPESPWSRAVRLAAERLPLTARTLGIAEAPHTRWSQTDTSGLRPPPFKALIDTLRPWLHRHIGPEAARTLAYGLGQHDWFSSMQVRYYDNPAEAAVEAKRKARQWIERTTGSVDVGQIEGGPNSMYELELDHATSSLTKALRDHLPLLSGWAPPPIDEWRKALIQVLVYGLAHAAIPIAVGLDRRSIAIHELRKWAHRRWGLRANDVEWLTQQLLATTFSDLATRELWLGTNDPIRAERVLFERLSTEAEMSLVPKTSHRQRRTPSLRVQLAQAARKTANALVKRLTAERWSSGRLISGGRPMQIQWHGHDSVTVAIPRHLISAIRYVEKGSRNESLPQRTKSGQIMVLAAKPIVWEEQNARAWVAIWERHIGENRRMLEAGRLIRRGTVATAEVWQTATTLGGKLAAAGRRGNGFLTWPPIQPAQEVSNAPKAPTDREELTRPGRNAAHRTVLPDGTISQNRKDRWHYNFRAAVNFAEQHEHLHPGRKDRPMGVNLWMWLRNQEARIDQGTLEPERLAALKTLPAWQQRQEKRTRGTQ